MNVSTIVPLRPGSHPEPTLRTLAGQTRTIILSHDDGHGANWARNRGAGVARSEYVLFSDDDIEWTPGAVKVLSDTLTEHPGAAYSYCGYEMGGKVYCDQPFSADLLRKKNFISTMSLIRRPAFPGFDESVQRLQDWDLWLTMLERRQVGVFCGRVLFRTEKRDGITFGAGISWEDAERVVKQKHGLA